MIPSRHDYDGASVNGRKKIQMFFLHRFFSKTAENKFKFFFSNVFPKQQKKEILLFLEKRWRKKILIFFLLFWRKNGGEKKFEFFFLPLTLAPSYTIYVQTVFNVI